MQRVCEGKESHDMTDLNMETQELNLRWISYCYLWYRSGMPYEYAQFLYFPELWLG